jgi:hypothetical protein
MCLTEAEDRPAALGGDPPQPPVGVHCHRMPDRLEDVRLIDRLRPNGPASASELERRWSVRSKSKNAGQAIGASSQGRRGPFLGVSPGGYRVLVWMLPAVVLWVTLRVCRELREGEQVERRRTAERAARLDI